MESPNTNTITPSPAPQSLIAAAYVRVSTEGQENEATIESQIDEVLSRIKKDGHILPPEFLFKDDGWTGSILQRPGLDAMRDSAAGGKFQILYVYDRGRLSRIFYHQELVINEINELGIQFVTLHDIDAITPEAKLMQSVQGIFHEYERLKIAERFRRGKMFKAKAGKLINGHAIYGYKIVREPGQPPRYEISEPEARVVRLVYKWFVHEQVSLRKIIERLYKLGIMPPKKKQDHWVKESIIRTLKYDTYSKGFIYFNKNEAIVAKNPTNHEKYKKVKKTSRKVRPKEEWIPYAVPTIIEDDGTYEKALEMLTRNQKYAKKNRKNAYLLTSLVMCGCGYKRTGNGRQVGHSYYSCTQKIIKHPKPTECTYAGINTKALDKAVWTGLVTNLTDPELLHKHGKLHLQAVTDNTSNQHDKARLQELIAKEEKIREQYALGLGTGDMELSIYQKLVRESKNKEAGYQKQLDDLQRQTLPSSLSPEDELWAMCIEATRIFKTMLPNSKKRTIRDVIDKVVVWRQEFDIQAHIEIPSPTINRNYELHAKSRHRWSAERGQVNPVQRAHPAGCESAERAVHDHTTKHRCGAGTRRTAR